MSTGCTTTPAPEMEGEMENAVLVNASPGMRAQLTRTISGALNGRSVRIAPESFTKSSRLIIEPKTVFRDGYPVQGRERGKPDHFYLKASAGQCYLFHQQTEKTYGLDGAQCEIIPAP